MAQEEAEGAGTHGNQAPNRLLLGMPTANGVRSEYFCKNPKKFRLLR
jgi:hypothetical protein